MARQPQRGRHAETYTGKSGSTMQEWLDDLAREMRKAIPEIEREMRANAVRAARIRAEGRPLF